MTTRAKLSLVWTNLTGCKFVGAEIWIENEYLWLTLFIDETDGEVTIELLPAPGNAARYLLNFAEAERLMESAKRDLLVMWEDAKKGTI